MSASPKHGRFVLASLFTVIVFSPSFVVGAKIVRADNVGAPAGVLGRHKLGVSVNSGVFQRDIQFKNTLDRAGASGEDKVVLTSIRPIVLKAQGNILDWLNPYGIFGIADLRLDENDFEGTMKPYFGGGAVFRLLDSLEAGPDISFQLHSAYTFNDDYVSHEGVNQSFDLNYWEAQAALILHKRVSNFTWFIGIGYSDTFFSELSGNGQNMEYSARTVPVGLFGGLDYFITPEVYVHSEMHNFVEDAIILGLGFNL